MSEQVEMADEYGSLDCSGDTYVSQNFTLESNEVLEEARVSFRHNYKSLPMKKKSCLRLLGSV